MALILSLIIFCSCLTVPVMADDISSEDGDAVGNKFEGLQIVNNYKFLNISVDKYAIPTIDEVPLYNQRDYPNVPYGKYGTIYSHGCAIACLSMVATYLTDKEYLLEDMAKQFGHYNTKFGTEWVFFEDSAEALGLKLQERTFDIDVVMEALENGQVVVSLQKAGLFTSGGHYIVLTGLTEDGKIKVNDPNGDNYHKNKTLSNGFKNGFTKKQIAKNAEPYWIYEKKQEKYPFVYNFSFVKEYTFWDLFKISEEQYEEN